MSVVTVDNVKVAVRCRPLNDREIKLKPKHVLDVDLKNNQIVLTKPTNCRLAKSFRFDYVYGERSTQKEVYEDTGYPLVESVLEGYNGTIFAYGQTGCGKTWTMEGPNDANKGIIPTAFQHIFDKVATDNDPSDNIKFLIRAGYIEIYNEEIRDLLGLDPLKKLNLRQDPEKGVFVENLTMKIVTNVDDTQLLMDKGRKSRVVGRTNMNDVSSRSHAIFVLNVETSTNDGEDIKCGKLNLVDLAGSERQSKTGAAGIRFKEATKINLSLSALGNVISALVEGKGQHIPYRDSKLTRLLQDSLGGNTKTVMIACISPAGNSYDETLSTLRYANRAKNIKNKPKINLDAKDALLKQYQDEIKKLKQMLSSKKQAIVYKQPKTTNHKKQYDLLKKEYTEYKQREVEQNDHEAGEDNDELMEQIYLLEAQLLDGGAINTNSANKKEAKKRLDDMKFKRSKRKQEKNKNKNNKKIKYNKDAQNEIDDLMTEFERQRSDLLQDIRMTHREMTLYRTIVYKLCDPITIDEIIFQSKWDPQNQHWILPNFINKKPTQTTTNTNTSYTSYFQSVKKKLNKINYNDGDSDLHLDILSKQQVIDNFDTTNMTNMKNVNEFENIQFTNKYTADSGHDFIQQITGINQENIFDANNIKIINNLNNNQEINIDNNFMDQISTIPDDNNAFKSDRFDDRYQEEFANLDKNNENIMEIADLMINDAPKQNLFQQHKINELQQELQQKQDIDIDSFFQEISNGDDEDEFSVDITELHQVLNRK